MIQLLIVIVLVLICYKLYKKHWFWQDQKVLCRKPVPLFGHIWNLIARKQSVFDFTVDLYNEFPGKRYHGHYELLNPILIINDLDLIKQICIKDFDHFYDHKPFGEKDSDPVMYRSLFNLCGEEWKHMRYTLSPAFTSKKMRGMFIFMCECADNFTDQLLKTNGGIEEEMFSLFSKYANDVISSSVFGITQNSLENPNNEFYQNGVSTTRHLMGMQLVLSRISPTLYKLLGCTLFPKEVVSFFSDVVRDNMAQREKYSIVRPDMIHLLMEAQKGRLKHEADDSTEVETGFATAKESQLEKTDADQEKTITHNEAVAQTLIFYLAGFDTTTTLLALAAYELALNPDCQEKLREEIVEKWMESKKKVIYEELLSMKYLDQVVSETLRKWPPGFRMDRTCTKRYTIPPVNGDEPTVTLEADQDILIPVVGIHRDPKYFPNPLKFDPERFSEENKSKIVPGSYTPFGFGPRNCIGSRFALLEAKVLLFHLLLKFDIVPTDKTPMPLRFMAKSLDIRAEGGYWLALKPRK